jgi:hypothetical protein
MRVLQTLALPLGDVAAGGGSGDNNRLSPLLAAIGDGYLQSALRAGDGIRTHDLLLGKETFYH